MAARSGESHPYFSNGVAADRDLTEEEKLLAMVIVADHRIPVGFQIGLPRHLDSAADLIDTLFTRHNLPLRREILGELARWHEHAQLGLTFATQCDTLMSRVIQHTSAAADRGSEIR